MRHLFILFLYDDRHTWPTYFSLKVGGTLGCGYRKICPRIIGYLTWIGCTISGDLIASSRMRRRLPSTRCRYQTIIFGCITIKHCFTCPSKSTHHNYYLVLFNNIIVIFNKCNSSNCFINVYVCVLKNIFY